MTTIDNRSDPQYGISLKSLRELMEHRGRDGILCIQALGGIQELCNKLKTSPIDGLTGSKSDCDHRREIYGSNTIPPKPLKSFLRLVWEAMQDVTLIVLEVAALLSLCLSFYKPQNDNVCKFNLGQYKTVQFSIQF